MSNDTIGGISIDELMKAAMTNLDESGNTEPKNNIQTKNNSEEKVSKNIVPENEPNINSSNFSVDLLKSTITNSDESNNTEPKNNIQAKNNSEEKISKNIVPENEPNINSPNFSVDLLKSTITNSDESNNTEPKNNIQAENNSEEKVSKNIVPENDPSIDSSNLSSEFINEYIRILDLIEHNRTVEAIKSAEILVDENISVPQAWHALGCAYRSENRNDDALKSFHQAIAYDNTYSLAYSEISALLCDIEDYENVKEYAEKALIYNKENTNAKLSMCIAMRQLEGLDPAIELINEYIEKSEDVERMQNTLGAFYVEKALEFAVEIPERPFFDPMAIAMDKIKNFNNDVEYDTYISFISEEDINDAKKYLDMATPLLTLDVKYFNDYKDVASEIYDTCENCLTLFPISNEKFIKVYQYLLAIFHLLIAVCTWGIGLPLMIAPFILQKANMVPVYVINYMIYFNSKSPLDFKEREFRAKIEKHSLLNKIMIDHEKERTENQIMRAVQLIENASLLKMFGSVLFDMHTFLLKCRLYYYKHFIQVKMKQKKEREAFNSVAVPATDEPKPEVEV